MKRALLVMALLLAACSQSGSKPGSQTLLIPVGVIAVR